MACRSATLDRRPFIPQVFAIVTDGIFGFRQKDRFIRIAKAVARELPDSLAAIPFSMHGMGIEWRFEEGG